MKRFSTLWLAGLGIMSAIFVSCSPAGLGQVSALVIDNGETAGLIIEYVPSIDKASVSADKYSVEGETIAKVFVSDVNPFSEPGDNTAASESVGSYVVALLKDNDSQKKADITALNEAPAISIRQTGAIKTTDGQTVKAWRKPVKASKGYLIPGGRIR